MNDEGHGNDAENRATVVERAAHAGADVAASTFRSDIAVETKSGKTDVVTQADRDAQARVIETIRKAYPEDAIVGEESLEPRSTDEASGPDPRAEDALKEVPDDGPAWVIDPIDGTNNYVRSLRVWGTAVAAVVDGDPVAAATVCPALGDVWTAGGDGAYRNGNPVSTSDETDPEQCTVAPTVWWGLDRRDEYAAACREVVERFADMRRFGCAQATLAMVADGSIDATITNVDTNPWDTVGGVHLVRQAGGVVTDLDGEPWRHDSTGLVASNGEEAIHEEALAAVRGIADADGD
jgi:myo-inositol-1(or 4)-monophosphatase